MFSARRGAKDDGAALGALAMLTKHIELLAKMSPRPPVPALRPGTRVRLVFTSRGLKTQIEHAGEQPPIETTAVPLLPAAEETEPAAVPPSPAAEPQRPLPPAPGPKLPSDLGGFPVNRAAPQAPDPYSREERDRRARRTEEATDAQEDQENEDARRGIGPGKWGAF